MASADWNPQVQPDFNKLGKLDKLLAKIEIDIQKRVKDQDKKGFVETLKKTHDIYQLVLGEMHFQLCELQLDKFGTIVMKVFTGINTLLNILLKFKTNLDFNPEKMAENLKNLQQEKKRKGSGQLDGNEGMFSQKESGNLQGVPQRGGQRFQRTEGPIKVFQDNFTSTTIDQLSATDLKNLDKKREELSLMTKEIDEGVDELEQFLKNRKDFSKDAESSQAEQNLKNVLKDLAKGQKKIKQLEAEELELAQKGDNLNQQFDQFGNRLMGQFNKMQNEISKNQVPEILKENQKLVNGVLIETNNMDTQTPDDNKVSEKYEKAKTEIIMQNQKLKELEKKFKEAKRDSDIFEDNIKKLNKRIEELQFLEEKRKQEDRKRQEELKNLTIMGPQEKEKFKKMAEENIRMKLKMREVLDTVTEIEREQKQNMTKFKNFIMGNPALTEEQKRLMLSKAEELFSTNNLSQKINLRELEQMSRIDENLLKDKFVKDCVGDHQQLLRKINKEEKEKKQKKLKPGYNADFDLDLLDENEQVVTRKVLKTIKRKDSTTGEWIEEQMEVEEEVIIDKRTGKELRKREKPSEGPKMDPTFQTFMKKHGGLAIGGSKFTKVEKPGKRPKRADGQEVVEGEWFQDENGNKVRMRRNKQGEEEWEMQEEFVDENGVKRVQAKRIKYRKDVNGNEVMEEEYVDPTTGRRMKVEKKTVKDKDGIDVIEQIVTDQNGKKTIKRTKVKKDKDGIDVIEDEFIDENGQKQIIRTKVTKDANGREIVTQEILNADGTKTIIIEKYDQNGNKIVVREEQQKDGSKKIVTEQLNEQGHKVVTEEQVDKRGKKQVVGQKVMKQNENGDIEVEEYKIDSNGQKITKTVKVEIDADGFECQVEEEIQADGTKKIKKKKFILDENGNDVEVTEITDSTGQKITKKKKKLVDEQGNTVIEEEIIEANGSRKIVRTKILADGTQEEEIIDPISGEKKIIRKRKDESGREIIEEVTIDKFGRKQIKQQIVMKDQNGNTIIQESYQDPLTGKKITVQKKITLDKNGKEITEQTEIDEDGNAKQVKKKQYKDKDGADIIEEEVIGANGKKTKIKQKVYYDKDGNRITEEEKIDENGNKITVKTVRKLDGTETSEQITTDKKGNKTVVQKQIAADGSYKETVIHANGKVETFSRKAGMDDKEIQCQLAGGGSLEDMLISMGLDKKKAFLVAQQIEKFVKSGADALIIGDEDKMNLSQINKGHRDSLSNLKDLKKKEMEDIRKGGKGGASDNKKDQDELSSEGEEDEEKLVVIDDGNLNEDQQMEVLYGQMNKKGQQMGELQRLIRNQLGLQGDQPINLEDFKDYLLKFKAIHIKCGENCPHLKRFYAKLGFIQNKYKRRFLKMKDSKIKGLDTKKLPKI